VYARRRDKFVNIHNPRQHQTILDPFILSGSGLFS